MYNDRYIASKAGGRVGGKLERNCWPDSTPYIDPLLHKGTKLRKSKLQRMYK